MIDGIVGGFKTGGLNGMLVVLKLQGMMKTILKFVLILHGRLLHQLQKRLESYIKMMIVGHMLIAYTSQKATRDAVMYKLDIELLHYINELLVDRERLLEERELDGKDYELNFVLKQETEWEIDTSIKAQKIITKLIEEQIDQ